MYPHHFISPILQHYGQIHIMCTSYFKVKVMTHHWIARGSSMGCCSHLQISQCIFNLPSATLKSKTKEIVEGNFQSPVCQEDTCASPI